MIVTNCWHNPNSPQRGDRAKAFTTVSIVVTKSVYLLQSPLFETTQIPLLIYGQKLPS